MLLTMLATLLVGCSANQPATAREAAEPASHPAPQRERASRCNLIDPAWNSAYALCQSESAGDRGRFEFNGRAIPIEYPDAGPAGHWSGGFVSRNGKTLLLQWIAECEVPLSFFVSTSGGKPRLTTGERRLHRARPSIAHGWTLDDKAIVELVPDCGDARMPAGLRLIDP
jgi:hypothetical protein